MSRRTVELETRAEVVRRLSRSISLAGCFVQSVDLSGLPELGTVDVAGAVFLGCRLDPGDEDDLRDRGALVFPTLPGLPFDPYRGSLYTPVELYGPAALGGSAGNGTVRGDRSSRSGPARYRDSLDATVYAWAKRWQARHDIAGSLGAALHDHAIGDALDDALAQVPKGRVVGVMGGHATLRGTAQFAEAVRLDPNHADAHRNLAFVQRQQREKATPPSMKGK